LLCVKGFESVWYSANRAGGQAESAADPKAIFNLQALYGVGLKPPGALPMTQAVGSALTANLFVGRFHALTAPGWAYRTLLPPHRFVNHATITAPPDGQPQQASPKG
jgi:hypothetical protein